MADFATVDAFFSSSQELIGAPERGLGERCLNCDQYSRCLAFAAEKDWESFTCQGCGYAYRGRANFGVADFTPIEEDTYEEGVYIFCQSQVDGLIICNEDLYETFFGKGLLDD